MRHLFVYDGVSSAHFHAWLASGNVFDAPERDVSEIEVPGRNGTLTIDNGRFRDMDLTYHAYVTSGFWECIGELRNFLKRTVGYRRLEDTFHSEEYRMAKYIDGFTIGGSDRVGGEFDLKFKCKPQRFLKSGEYPIRSAGSVKLWNPTEFNALPLIRVYGTSGNLMVGNTIIRLDKIGEYVDIDCETQNAYKGIENCNGNIYAPDFPVLLPGENGVSFEGNIEEIEITPRWYRI